MNETFTDMMIDSLTEQLPDLIVRARGWDPYVVDDRDFAMRRIGWIDNQILEIAR